MLERERIPLGIIVNGAGDEELRCRLDRGAAEQHLTAFEAALGVPDQIVFQSWNRFPQTLLPESDPGAFTWLLEGGAP